MKIKTALQATGLRKVYDYVDKDPHKRLPQVVSAIEKFVPSGSSIDGTIKGINTFVYAMRTFETGGYLVVDESLCDEHMGRHRRRRAQDAV